MQDTYHSSFNAEVRAAAIFALGCCINSGSGAIGNGPYCDRDQELFRIEQDILALLQLAVTDGAMLVRTECALAIGRAAMIPPGTQASAQARELSHHDHFVNAFQRQKQRVVQYVNQQRMRAIVMDSRRQGGRAAASFGRTHRDGLQGTRSETHGSIGERVHVGFARSEDAADGLTTYRTGLPSSGVAPIGCTTADCEHLFHV